MKPHNAEYILKILSEAMGYEKELNKTNRGFTFESETANFGRGYKGTLEAMIVLASDLLFIESNGKVIAEPRDFILTDEEQYNAIQSLTSWMDTEY